jgi:diaminohydroxyphosphoribosylaminopyrimidine deaminase/5-amino-6-(5-phosphoribosylamino)uracil reductase
MGAALALAERGRGRTFPNPNVGCVIVKDDKVVGRGWTQPGGRPHAEGMALAEAGNAARGATAFVTLEPCAHRSPRGPACAPSLAEAGIKRVVAALGDPDPRTCGRGFHDLRSAGVIVIEGVRAEDARRSMAGFLTRQHFGRPHVTLKLAVSLDGCIALANGESRWITGGAARAHVHLERARHDAILVGRRTYAADAPRLDVRLPGLEDRSPLRVMLTSGEAPEGWAAIKAVADIATLPANNLFVEGGAKTAVSFLKAGLVDRLLLYTAPILLGGKPALGDLSLTDLAAAHGVWNLTVSRMLGVDRLQVYERN